MVDAALIAFTPLGRPFTSTGTRLSVVVPSPSSPSRLRPQHLTPPESVSAQVWSPLALIALTPLPRPTTSTGTRLRTVRPSPSCPYAL